MTESSPDSATAGDRPASFEQLFAEAASKACYLPLIQQVRQELSASPRDELAHLRLARLLFAAGDVAAAQAEADWVTRFAIDWHQRVEAWQISIAAAPHSPALDVLDLRALSQRWSGHLMASRLGLAVPPPAPRQHGWPLRIGYLLVELPGGADFLPPQAHDPTRIAATTYWRGPGPAPDPAFADLSGISCEAAALRMRQDDLDILVDLCPAGQAATDMLTMLRPARIQVGFGNRLLPDYDTGHDRVLGDALLFGGLDFAEGEGVGRHVMPSPVVPFAMPAPRRQDRPPAGRDGRLTLAALPDAGAIDPASLALWAQLLAGLPNARFVITARQVSDLIANRILQAFADAGVDGHRVTLSAGRARHDSLANADLVVDGLTGSSDLDTLALCRAGIPVVAACGDRLSRRRSASILTAIGHDELATDCVQGKGHALLQAAYGLAGNPDRLAQYRAILPAAVERSGLADPARAVARLEEALATIWRQAVQAVAG